VMTNIMLVNSSSFTNCLIKSIRGMQTRGRKHTFRSNTRTDLNHCCLTCICLNIVACYLEAVISEAEQASIASQRFDNTHIRGNQQRRCSQLLRNSFVSTIFAATKR
jgi:hypothetical protein